MVEGAPHYRSLQQARGSFHRSRETQHMTHSMDPVEGDGRRRPDKRKPCPVMPSCFRACIKLSSLSNVDYIGNTRRMDARVQSRSCSCQVRESVRLSLHVGSRAHPHGQSLMKHGMSPSPSWQKRWRVLEVSRLELCDKNKKGRLICSKFRLS